MHHWFATHHPCLLYHFAQDMLRRRSSPKGNLLWLRSNGWTKVWPSTDVEGLQHSNDQIVSIVSQCLSRGWTRTEQWCQDWRQLILVQSLWLLAIHDKSKVVDGLHIGCYYHVICHLVILLLPWSFLSEGCMSSRRATQCNRRKRIHWALRFSFVQNVGPGPTFVVTRRKLFTWGYSRCLWPTCQSTHQQVWKPLPWRKGQSVATTRHAATADFWNLMWLVSNHLLMPAVSPIWLLHASFSTTSQHDKVRSSDITYRIICGAHLHFPGGFVQSQCATNKTTSGDVLFSFDKEGTGYMYCSTWYIGYA